jgi:hypothetical protein
VEGQQDFSLETEIATRVAEVDGTGKARLEGSRTFSVENRDELITIGGWIDPTILDSGRRVSFSQLADARLQFRTFLQPSAPTLSAADIEEVIETIEIPVRTTGALPAEAEDAAAPAAPAAQPAAPQAETVIQERRSYQLSQEKKLELFLIYINRMVDLLFQ